jgi:N6-L-threonylcarbamoyladenine synthase
MLVLGIETSCDETAAAVIRDGREIVSSVISSQIKTHEKFGGVVPELASREHLDKIVPIVEEALSRAAERTSKSTASPLRMALAWLDLYSWACRTRRPWRMR